MNFSPPQQLNFPNGALRITRFVGLAVVLFLAMGAQVLQADTSSANSGCPAANVRVSNGDQLRNALRNATAGSVIYMADGVYRGGYEMGGRQGTADRPIWVCGSRKAVIDYGTVEKGRALSVYGSAYVNFKGFTLQNALQGMMVQNSNNIRAEDLRVVVTGYEGIHFYQNTHSSVIANNFVASTGKVEPDYGEGIYLGTSERRWDVVTGGQPDRTRNIKVLNNSIRWVGAEGIEAKEGTSDGLIEGNFVDGHRPGSKALGWIRVTGNNYVVRGNSGARAVENGIRLQVWRDWGTGNLVENNTGKVDAPGYGVSVHTPGGKIAKGTVVKCNNNFTGAASGQISLQRGCWR